MIVYIIHNKQLKKWFCSDNSVKGYRWSNMEEATMWIGENKRSPAYSARRKLLNEQGYSEIEVQKYEMRQIKDI